MRKLPNRPIFTITEKLVGYFLCGVFSLILWAITLWVWRTLWDWFVPPTNTRWDWTIVFTVLVLAVPFLVYNNMFSPDRPVRPAAPASATAPDAARRATIPFLGWLYWLGNGELHIGTLVLFVVIFWSLFYWNWSTVQAMIATGSGVFALSFWGLITIFGTVIIRSAFSRLPGREVPGVGDSKSKPK